MDEMLISSRWDCLLNSILTRYCINSCYWKLLGKYCQTVIHELFHCSTVYKVILSILLLLHHWYCYCHHIVPVIEITWILIALNNNVNRQLTPGLGKSMEETTSIFWVDLVYRLRSRLGVPLQGSWEMTDIPSVLLLFHCSHSEITVTVTEYLAVRLSSAPENWGRSPGYVWDPPKTWAIFPTDQIQ